MDTKLKIRMSPPLSLLVLGALTPAEHHVWLEDENVERLTLNDTPDLVGITVKVDTAQRSYAIAKHYRDRGIPVVLGGIHATACPDEASQHADAVVVGEAEDSWSVLLRDLAADRLQPIYRQAHPVDPARIPTPRWAMLDGKDYLWSNTLTISRGCSWRCKFCYNSSPNVTRGHRIKPTESILRDIDSVRTRHLFFIDDNFAGSPEKTHAVLDAIAPLQLTWGAAVSADIVHHPDLLDRFAATGCKSLFIGFETINADNIACCAKSQNKGDDYDRLIDAIHSRGMMVNASVAFGFDHDGPDVFQRTLDWLTARKIESMTAHILTPYPGTEFHDELTQQGRIVDTDSRHYNTAYAVFEPKGMTREQLQAGYHWIYKQFYSFRHISKRYPGGAKQRMAYLAFNLGYRKFGTLTSHLASCLRFHTLGRLGRRLAYRRN